MVLPKRYRKQVEYVLESIDETEEDFFRIFHSLQKQEGYKFADTLLMAIMERATFYYYLIKYLDRIRQLHIPRDKNESPSEYIMKVIRQLKLELL